MKSKLYFYFFVFSVLVHIFYYISAHFTHTLDIFFENVTRGQDFFQIPNGAYSFINGGGLQGDIPQTSEKYIDCCGVNPNVYLPVLTLLVGLPLIIFEPWTSFYIWVGMHALTTIFTLLFLWRKFKNNSQTHLAFSIFLLFPFHYYEIQHSQFHFLVNFFFLFFLYETTKTKTSSTNDIKSGLFMFLTLIIKPIALVWTPSLLIYRKYRLLFIALPLFAVTLLISYLIPEGKYFFNNLAGASRISATSYNLAALGRFFDFNLDLLKYLSYALAAFLLLFQLVKKPALFTMISLWIIWTTLFYAGVYHYYYTTIATIILIGMLTKNLKLNTFSITGICGLLLPTPIIFLKLTGSPAILPEKELSAVALWSSTFLIFLAAGIIKPLLDKKHYDSP